jgi:hypothetical protein
MTTQMEKRESPPTLLTECRSGQSEGIEHRDMAVGTSHVGVITDPDCLGPCEPGTSVVLEGIVWHETDNGNY